MTVLASLNTRFPAFTLQSLLDEIARWAENGISLFQAELDEIKMAHAAPRSLESSRSISLQGYLSEVTLLTGNRQLRLNLSNQQISKELNLHKDDVQKMTSELRQAVVDNKPKVTLKAYPC